MFKTCILGSGGSDSFVLARCSAGIMSLTAAITLILLDGGHLSVGFAATASRAAAQHRRATVRPSSVQNLAKSLARQSQRSSRISVMASNILFPFNSRLCQASALIRRCRCAAGCTWQKWIGTMTGVCELELARVDVSGRRADSNVTLALI